MISIQIQLDEDQATALKKLAAAQNKSVAELIRMSVDALLATTPLPDVEGSRARALAVVGRFRTGDTDLAEDHDRYLFE
jgi:hypothetical protein